MVSKMLFTKLSWEQGHHYWLLSENWTHYSAVIVKQTSTLTITTLCIKLSLTQGNMYGQQLISIAVLKNNCQPSSLTITTHHHALYMKFSLAQGKKYGEPGEYKFQYLIVTTKETSTSMITKKLTCPQYSLVWHKAKITSHYVRIELTASNAQQDQLVNHYPCRNALQCFTGKFHKLLIITWIISRYLAIITLCQAKLSKYLPNISKVLNKRIK